MCLSVWTQPPYMIKIHLLFFFFFFITDENRKEEGGGGGIVGMLHTEFILKDICITYSFIVTVMYFFLPYVQNCHFSLSHKYF